LREDTHFCAIYEIACDKKTNTALFATNLQKAGADLYVVAVE
jgi:hypothetical protein